MRLQVTAHAKEAQGGVTLHRLCHSSKHLVSGTAIAEVARRLFFAAVQKGRWTATYALVCTYRRVWGRDDQVSLLFDSQQANR